MSAWTAGVAGLAAGCLVKTTVLAALALLAAAAAKRRSAAFRHFVLSAALAGLVFLPLLSLAPVGWRTPLLPSWAAARSSAAALGPEGPLADIGSGLLAPETAASAAASPVPAEPAAGVSTAPGTAAFAGLPDPGVPGAKPPATAGRAGAADRLGLVLAIAWAAGIAAFLLRVVFGLAGAARLTAQGKPLEGPAWRALVERFLALVSLRRLVRLRSHPRVAVPLTWGWRRPVVLFPEGAEAWSEDERSSALYHELCHIKRADFLVMLLVRTGLALFWWNPLCWLAYRRLLREQEIACDELVLRAGIRPSTYAASLLAVRRSAGLRWNPSAALPGLLGRSPFQQRLTAILGQKWTFMEVKMRTKITIALTLVAAVALIGTARPASGHDGPQAKTVLAETALPAADSPAAVIEPRAAVQDKGQEKAKEAAKAQEAGKAEKAKAADVKAVTVVSEDEDAPVEITIVEKGRPLRKLLFKRGATITKSENGDILVLTPEDKEPIVLTGEPLSLRIKGDHLEVIEEGGAPEHGRAATVKIVKEAGEEGQVEYWLTPRSKVRTFTLAKEGEAGAAWTVKEAPNETVWISEGKTFALTTKRDAEMLKKVQALQEQVQAIKAKKMDLSTLEESLKKLEAELKAKEEKLRAIESNFDKEPGRTVVSKTIVRDVPEKGVAIVVSEKDEDLEPAEAETLVKVSEGQGAIAIILGRKGLSRGDYEQALAKLKKDLPEGYALAGSEFDEKAGSMSFRISAAEGKTTDKEFVRRLVDSLRPEIEKK
ncbi:MAG TPA: M56 family metallopeptidase [Candidatus Aminicenantes bacterium]|nr:M56 family metallopeptidase [Candidatus Aminicenantes bacterium]HRY65771.1 M56 family metallopeptidase [Candidatus Aminicenantes bacterium]HRZ72685.1 M56 family metallopeptidase [Candidatus Aminicenantes bacterium]